MQATSAHIGSYVSIDGKSELSLHVNRTAFDRLRTMSCQPMKITNSGQSKLRNCWSAARPKYDIATPLRIPQVCLPLVSVEGIANNNVSDRATGRKSSSWCIYATENRKVLVPLRLETSEGQALMEILLNGGLVSRAASRQLEHCAAERQRACTCDEARTSTNEDNLQRKITALREKERTIVVQDIIYALVAARLIEAGWTMASPIVSAACERKTDFVQGDEKKLQEALHAPEVRELVEEHVAMVIGGRQAATDAYNFDPDAFTRICNLRIGKIYAASVMYGYYLRKIYQRFKLDERLIIRAGSEGWEFKAYVGSLDSETQRFHGRMRGEESIQVIERHVEALFGKPEALQILHGSSKYAQHGLLRLLYVKLSAVRGLLLEAIAFGSALWDAEAFVASSYPLSLNDE